MSNIHGLNDLNRNQGGGGGGANYGRMGGGGGGPPAPPDPEAQNAASLFQGMAGGGLHAEKRPRQENYFDMWQTTFCPTFSPVSFTFLVWALNSCVYLASVSVTAFWGTYSFNNAVFLGPDPYLLDDWGALNRYEIYQNYQWWRLLTSLFLTPGLMFFGINSVILMIVGFMVENKKMSILRMGAMYIGMGVFANLFTICCEQARSVDNAGCLSGLVCALLSGVILNWTPLKGMMNGMFGLILILNCVIFFVFILMFSFSSDLAPDFKQQSLLSVAGGIFSGLGFGLMLMPYAPERPSPKVAMLRKIGAALIFLMLAVLLPVFLFVIKP